MIARKPKLTEEQFLRGADTKRARENGSKGESAIKHVHFRLPDALYERLREIAWARRTNVNALMVSMLEENAASVKVKK